MKKKFKMLLSLTLVLTMLIGYSPTVVIHATETDATTSEETTSEEVIEEDSIDSKTAPTGDFATGDSIPKDLFTTDATYDN